MATINDEKILIIDDELDFVEAFRRTLEAKSYQVTTASSRAQAQEMIAAGPNIVVLGTIAPAGQAFAVHQWLKQHHRYKDMPLLVIDAQYEEQLIRGWRTFEGMELEAEEYVRKPISPASLVPRIQSLLEACWEKPRHRMINNGTRILIIDDELDFVEAFRRTLEAKSYQVTTASSRAQAQEMIAAEPNIVVLGTIAPAGQAFAMQQWLKQHPRYKDMPLLVIDAQYEEQLIRGWRTFEGMELEAEEYVRKPIEPASLVPRIQSLL